MLNEIKRGKRERKGGRERERNLDGEYNYGGSCLALFGSLYGYACLSENNPLSLISYSNSQRDNLFPYNLYLLKDSNTGGLLILLVEYPR